MTKCEYQDLIICTLADLPDGSAKGFEILEGSKKIPIFITRKGNNIYAYQNSCPHTGSPLDWVPDKFLDKERRNLMCATHGALFEIETGECFVGPCKGDSLNPINVSIMNKNIVITMPL